VSGRLRPAVFALGAAGLAFVASYVLFEAVVQVLARAGAIREYADLAYFQANVLDAVAREGTHPVAPVDDVLGWTQGSLTYGPPTAPDGTPSPTLLFLGDSVTFGDAAERGADDYVTRVAEALAPRRVHVVNAAASGYGVDQMMLRLERELAEQSPRWVLVAYIPHDLLRIGHDRFIRLTKPFVEPVGPGLIVHPPQDLEAWYAGQARALATARYGPWLIAERWAQRRALVPGLHLGWYETVLGRIVARMANDAREAEAALTFVEIPNYADAEATALLAPIMRRVLEAGADAGRHGFVRLEPCLERRAAPAPWPTPEFSDAHPGRAGHADLAACVLAEAVEPLLDGVRAGSSAAGSQAPPRRQEPATREATMRSARSPKIGWGSAHAASAIRSAASSGAMPSSSADASRRRVVQ
jgi:hypothetical protein